MSGMKDYRLVQVDRDSKLSDALKLHFVVCRSVEKDAGLLWVLRERILEK